MNNYFRKSFRQHVRQKKQCPALLAHLREEARREPLREAQRVVLTSMERLPPAERELAFAWMLEALNVFGPATTFQVHRKLKR